MWSEEEFGRAELGDASRTKRLTKIAEARALKPSASLPEGFKNEAELEARYDFGDNEAIERNPILASHVLATLERIRTESIVLAVPDPTYVDYSHHPSTKGLGMLADDTHQGLLLHPTLVVTTAQVPLGLIDEPIIYRDPANVGKSNHRNEPPITETDSYQWLESLEKTAEIQKQCPATQLISIGDREADVYDLFLRSNQLGQDILIRGAWNRAVDHEEK